MNASTELDFAAGLQVVSSARKLIFLVPAGPVVNFPEGAVISKYGQNNESPVIVVLNHVDNGGTWQGADVTNGIVIMNNVSEAVALELLEMFGADRTIGGLKSVIARAEELGCLDNYTTKVQFADDNLSPAGLMLDNYTGIVKRDARDICLVIRDGNGVIQRQLPNGSVNHIDTNEILVRDYVHTDGSQIDPDTIPFG